MDSHTQLEACLAMACRYIGDAYVVAQLLNVAPASAIIYTNNSEACSYASSVGA